MKCALEYFYSAKGAKYESQGQVPTLSGRRPWTIDKQTCRRALKGRDYGGVYFGLSGLAPFWTGNQGRRAPLRFALAPGSHITRLWRFL